MSGRSMDARRDSHGRTPVFYRRLGRLMGHPLAQHLLTSRGIQIAGTWRSHFAWHLANALGWRAAR